MRHRIHFCTHSVTDPVVAALVLLLGAPVWLLVVLLASWDQNGKPFFFQVRIGYREKPFTLLKIRTLRESRANAESEPSRLTRTGRLLRRTCLDEWPQLINILKGDMFWIGPRPLLPEYLPHYSEEQKKRHWVRPGLTGLSQIRGGNRLDWPTRLASDVEYIYRKSFVLDLFILIKTIYFVTDRIFVQDDSSLFPERFDENSNHLP